MSLERRKPLERKARLRADPAKTREWQDRSRRALPQESERTKQEKPQRRAAVAVARARDGDHCALERRGDCSGILVGHEVVKRSALRGSHLDDRFIVHLCWFHNGWLETIPTVDQEVLGLTVPRAIYDQHGQAALDEAARIRSLSRPTMPFWRL